MSNWYAERVQLRVDIPLLLACAASLALKGGGGGYQSL
jgi:hypothetical protein